MDNEKIEGIIEKIMEGQGPFRREDDEYSRTDPSVARIAARSGARTGEPESREPEKKQSYEDWVKSQPKSGMPIGMHKRKKK